MVAKKPLVRTSGGPGLTEAQLASSDLSDGPFATAGQTFYLGSTSIAINRASASIALTGITSIDGSSASCAGNAATVTGATFTTTLTNQGGAGVLAWPAAGATLTIPTGGGTLASGAFTAAYTLPTATNSVLGGVKPDGTSILNTAGVISATAASVGAAATSHTQAVSTISDSTTIGQNVVKLTNPSAITFPRFNADNTVTALNAADFKTAIGATGGAGDVVGPAGATDGHLAVFDGATGKLLKDGGAIPTGGSQKRWRIRRGL